MISVELNGAEVRRLQSNDTGRDLCVIAARGLVFSSWRASPEELELLKLGKPVWVVIKGELVPEFYLVVGDRGQVIPPEVIRKAQRQEAVLSSPAGRAEVARTRRERVLVEVLAWTYAVVALMAASLVLWKVWSLLLG